MKVWREPLVCLLLLGTTAVGARLTQRTTLAGVQRHQAVSDAAAFLEYGRRMRTGFAFQVKAMCRENADILKKFQSGAYDEHPAEFESDTTSFCSALRESVLQFDAQAVPDVLEKSHAKISRCHGLCYESILTLRKAYRSNGAERRRLLLQSERFLRKAWRSGDAGVKLHNEIWARATNGGEP